MTESNPTARVWLITGCSSGLGRALARAALQRGDRVFATARNRETLGGLQAEFPGTCQTGALDVTEAKQIAAGVEAAVASFGRLDVLVNNAGAGLTGALEELDDEQIARNLDVNFLGATRLIRAVLPHLRAQRAGHIVNISAAAAISNYAGFSIYGAAKWALEGLSEAVAAEVKPLGIKVTVVEPGPLRTDFAGRSQSKAARQISDYDATSGKFARLIDSMNGRQTGDPEKAASAILAAVDAANPPLRLVLGKYAHDKVRKRLDAVARELAEWEPIGSPIEFSARP